MLTNKIFRSSLQSRQCNGMLRLSPANQRPISLAGWVRKRKRAVVDTPTDGAVASKSASNGISNSTSGSNANGALSEGSPSASLSSSSFQEFSLVRFVNPWIDLSRVTRSEEILYDKVESTTRTFGIVSALMGSLAAALLTFDPYDGYDANRERVPDGHESSQSSSSSSSSGKNEESSSSRPFSAAIPKIRRNRTTFIEHVTFTHHVSGTSLLVSWGIPPPRLDDIYAACCAGSFYCGVCTTVLSSILNAWLAATPSTGGAVRRFVRGHSWFIVSMPAMLGVSTGLAGMALFIGLDRAHGTPVSYVGLGGTLVGAGVIGSATVRGWIGSYRLLTEAVRRL